MNKTATENDIRQIVAAFNAGQQVEAVRLCEVAIARNHEDPVLNHLQALAYFALDDNTGALAAAERSLSIRPDSPGVRLLAGRAARALNWLEIAECHFRQVPLSILEGLIELARTLEMSGKRREAQSVWLAVRRAEPSSREATARLGRIEWENGNFETARELLTFAVDEGAPASAWFDLGLARQDCGDIKGAVDAFRAALLRKPDDAEAAFNLGAALQNLGDIDAAVDAYRAAYGISSSTLGMIANSLTSGSIGFLFIDKSLLKAFLSA